MRLADVIRTCLSMAPCVILMGLLACKPSMPDDIISPGKMEDILYDYHLADGIAYAEGNYDELGYRKLVYREAALRKHGVTQAEFDSSMVYYYRHTEKLHDIYLNLAKRLNNDALALGATANELGQLGGEVSSGDTATVWSDTRSAILMPVAPFNVVSFEVKADTSYHAGDRLLLSFDGQFIFQDGMRDCVAMLAVTFTNDSVATQVQHLSSDSHYTIQVYDNDRIGVKGARGFIYLTRGQNNDTQTLKLMSVSNMKLLKMHTQPPKEGDEETQTSVPNGPPAQPVLPVQTGIPSHPLPPQSDRPASIHPTVPTYDKPASLMPIEK